MTPGATPPSLDGWEQGSGWGWVWGEDDEVGAMNEVGPEHRLHALSRISEGHVYDLGVLMNNESYLSPFHVGTEVLPYRTPDGLLKEGAPGFEDPNGVSYNTSMVQISDHAGTQIDGLCHATFGEDRHWYNGYTADEYGSDFGPKRAAAHNIPPIINSGLLIDVAGEKGVDNLDAGEPIHPQDLEAALDSQDTTIEPGDAVFIRTGVLRHWDEVGADHERLEGPDTAGLTLEATRWLVEEKGALIVGSDTSTVEVTPAVDGDSPAPVHKYLLVDQGVHMAELHDLEELSRDSVFRFCYIALPPKIKGITGGFALRPIAVI